MSYAFIKIKAPIQFISPQLANGDPNPYWPLVTTLNDAIDSQRKSRSYRKSDGQTVEWNGELDLNIFDLDSVLLVASNGGQVEGFPTFLEITSLDDALPAELQFEISDSDDPDGPSTTATTISQWNQLGHDVITRDGRNFISTAAHNGTYLDGQTILAIQSSMTVVSLVDLPAADPEPEV